ncbi:hypothetical protein WMF26_24920 [Sorangium sp. So ce185]|uniref:hypothetical protein n=1 Tax=Sorangium sp. So ce185 TaxID=3133287 RepID=UPI003F6212A4
MAFAELGQSSHCIIDKDDVRCDPRHLVTTGKGVGLVGIPFAMAGDFPTSAWLASAGAAGGDGGRRDWIYRWRGDRWEEPKDNVVVRCIGIARWSQGRPLALVDPGRSRSKQKRTSVRFQVLEGRAGDSLPELPDLGYSHFRWGFTALPGGEIFVLGTTGTAPPSDSAQADSAPAMDPTPGNVIVERWAAGARKPVVVRIPGLHSDVKDLEKVNYNGIFSALTAGDIFVAGIRADDVNREVKGPVDPKPYLLHFDGASWSIVDTPLHKPVRSMARTPDGALLVASYSEQVYEGEVWHRSPAGTWTRILVPPVQNGRDTEHVQPLSVWVAPGGDAWVLAAPPLKSKTNTAALYRSRPVSSPVTLPGPHEVENAWRQLDGSGAP